MRKFYYFKLFQAVLAFVIVWQILSIEKLCGKFAEPKCFYPTEACDNFTIFKQNAETTELNADNETKWIQLNDLPTGEGCLPINISIVSTLRNGYNCGVSNQLKDTADALARVLYLCLLFLFALVFHTLAQQPSEEYDLFGYLCAAYSVLVLGFSTVTTILESVNWTTLWECTNFRPYQSFLLFLLLPSVILFCSVIYETFSNCSLLKESDAENAQKQTVDKVSKISAIRGLKNDEFTIRDFRG